MAYEMAVTAGQGTRRRAFGGACPVGVCFMALDQWWWDLRWWWRIPTFPLYLVCMVLGGVFEGIFRMGGRS